jgi:hypothetical protein
MEDEHLTADECDELADALLEDAATLPSGNRETSFRLAEGYRTLSVMKRMVSGEVN